MHFYPTPNRYGALSSFWPHGIELDGAWWQIVGHHFRSRRLADAAYQEKTRTAQGPVRAKKLGRSRKPPIRPDREEIKGSVMLEACLQKVRTHGDPRKPLHSTGDEELVQNALNDRYRRCGKSGLGKNRPGDILVRVREELRKRP